MATDKALNNALITSGSFEFTPTGVVATGTPDIKDWQGAYKKIKLFAHCIHWIIGDMLNYGQEHYGEEFSQVLDEYDWGTIKNDKYICGRIPYGERNENLSFEHHKAVAPFDPSVRSRLIQRADKEMLSVRQFREVISKETYPDKSVINPERINKIKRSLAQAYVFIELMVELKAVPENFNQTAKRILNNLYSNLGEEADEIIKSFKQ